MYTKNHIKELIANREAARTKVRKEWASSITSQTETQSLSLFLELWNFYHDSENYRNMMSSELVMYRREHTKRNAQIYARLRK